MVFFHYLMGKCLLEVYTARSEGHVMQASLSASSVSQSSESQACRTSSVISSAELCPYHISNPLSPPPFVERPLL